MIVADTMETAPVTVQSTATVSEASALMNEHGIRHLPVLQGEALVGVISDLDLLSSRAAGRTSPGPASAGEPRVAAVMCEAPVTTSPDATAARAAALLASHEIGCLPVVREGVLVGWLTETDLLELLVGESRYGRLAGGDDPAVRTCMRSDPPTIPGDETLGAALSRMRDSGARFLPVVDADRRLIALATERDLRRSLSEGASSRTPLADVATSVPSFARTDEPLSLATLRLARERIGAQPVVDEQERLLGLLTTTDVLGHLARTLD